MAKNEKLYLALMAAFAMSDAPDSDNDAAATAASDVIDAIVETLAVAIVSAQAAALTGRGAPTQA